jgi:hypothetical protein
LVSKYIKLFLSFVAFINCINLNSFNDVWCKWNFIVVVIVDDFRIWTKQILVIQLMLTLVMFLSFGHVVCLRSWKNDWSPFFERSLSLGVDIS